MRVFFIGKFDKRVDKTRKNFQSRNFENKKNIKKWRKEKFYKKRE